MRAFAEAYPSEQIVQQLAGQIPWWHNVVIITRIKDPELQDWVHPSLHRERLEQGGAYGADRYAPHPLPAP